MSSAHRFTTGLVLKDTAVARDGRPIVAGASFELAPGEILLMKGANGAGKTTLLRAIAGLMPVEAGRVEVKSADGKSAAASARREAIVYCGHADGVKSAMTAFANLQFWATLYGVGDGDIADAIEALGLANIKSKLAGSLSAGQRRRLGLARLIVSQKPVWLLDEPAASMDAPSIDNLTAILAKHGASGGCALIATHNELPMVSARTIWIEAAQEQP